MRFSKQNQNSSIARSFIKFDEESTTTLMGFFDKWEIKNARQWK